MLPRKTRKCALDAYPEGVFLFRSSFSRKEENCILLNFARLIKQSLHKVLFFQV